MKRRLLRPTIRGDLRAMLPAASSPYVEYTVLGPPGADLTPARRPRDGAVSHQPPGAAAPRVAYRPASQILALVVALLPGCATPQVSYRRVGNVTPPPNPPGCPLDLLQSPGERPTVVIGEIRCDPGDGIADACIQLMKDEACKLGGSALGVGPTDGRILTASVLRYGDTIPGWEPPAPPAPVCDPPCQEGLEICTAEGCKPDPAGPPAPPALDPEVEAEMRAALDRVERRVLRCTRDVPEGPIKVHVEVEPSGNVLSVRIEGDVSTEAGTCAEQAIFAVTFTPFEGENRTITHEFSE